MSLSAAAEAAGLTVGQPLRDATAMCPDLVTVPADPQAEAWFLTGLRRWAGKFQPLGRGRTAGRSVGGPDGLCASVWR